MTLFHINTHTLYGSSRRVRPRNGFLILFLFLHLHWCERTGQLKANSTLFCTLSVFIVGWNSRYRATGYPSTEEGPRKGKCMLMYTQFTTYACTSQILGRFEILDKWTYSGFSMWLLHSTVLGQDSKAFLSAGPSEDEARAALQDGEGDRRAAEDYRPERRRRLLPRPGGPKVTGSRANGFLPVQHQLSALTPLTS